MRIIFVCHTEYDLNNHRAFEHLSILFDFVRSLDIPITFALMVGKEVGDSLLKFLVKKRVSIPKNCEISIHFHQNGASVGDYLHLFEKFLATSPNSIVFGKWQISNKQFLQLAPLGIKRDASWIPKMHNENYIIKAPFYLSDILEVPSSADGQNPLNPFSRLSHFFLLRQIIKKHHQDNLLLQIAFHSYDLFSFGGQPRLRWLKKCQFKHLLKLIKKYNLPIITLDKVDHTDFQGLKTIRQSFLTKLFQLFGH